MKVPNTLPLPDDTLKLTVTVAPGAKLAGLVVTLML
jgi:hypothetical protein